MDKLFVPWKFVISEHLSSPLLPGDRFMEIHLAPVAHHGGHLLNLVIQPQKSTCVYEEDLSSFPFCWVLIHISRHSISCFATGGITYQINYYVSIQFPPPQLSCCMYELATLSLQQNKTNKTFPKQLLYQGAIQTALNFILDHWTSVLYQKYSRAPQPYPKNCAT